MSNAETACHTAEKSNTLKLSIYSCESISRDQVIELAKSLTDPIGLAYSPKECVLLKLVADKWMFWNEEKVPEQSGPKKYVFDRTFELRLFSKQGEFRWLNDTDPKVTGGTATFITDSEQTLPESLNLAEWNDVSDSEDAAYYENVEALSNQYLLWGEAHPEKDEKDNQIMSNTGWSCLATGRIGKLFVPKEGTIPLGEDEEASPTSKHRVILKTREYIGLEPGLPGEHGNTTILAERLLELEVSSGIIKS